jgi:hypothetical protein
MLDASQPRMVRIPDHPAGARSISLDRQLRIAEDGAIHGVDTMTVTGSVAGYLRGWLRNLQASDRTSSVQRLLGGYGATELKVQAIDHLDDPQAPLVMRVAYRAVEPLHRERERMVGRLPVPWERHHLEPTATEERRFPFEIREPLRFSSSIELQWPRGYRLKTADPKAGGDTDPLRWSVQPSGAKVELSLRLSRGVFSADRFAGYARELRSALEALRGPIVLSR